MGFIACRCLHHCTLSVLLPCVLLSCVQLVKKVSIQFSQVQESRQREEGGHRGESDKPWRANQDPMFNHRHPGVIVIHFAWISSLHLNGSVQQSEVSVEVHLTYSCSESLVLWLDTAPAHHMSEGCCQGGWPSIEICSTFLTYVHEWAWAQLPIRLPNMINIRAETQLRDWPQNMSLESPQMHHVSQILC